MEEIWKDIPEYEGLYQASNLGNIRSLDIIKNIISKNQFTNFSVCYVKKGKLLKPHIKKGYLTVVLNKEKKPNTKLIHRLIAETFILNKDSKKQVNHKDENKLNNRVDNLEWCTSSYNINYGDRNNKVSNKLKGKPKSKEHKEKLSVSAKKRTIIRDNKGRIISVLGSKKKGK